MECESQPYSPPKIADLNLDDILFPHAIDFLHDDLGALQQCCFVHRSWLRHAREHLFSHVHFKKIKQLRRLKEYFPDPLCSPLTYTRSLSIGPDCLNQITKEDASFIRSSFVRLERLEVRLTEGEVSDLSLFHNLSSTVKYLSLGWSEHAPGQVLDLICSFPFLESLRVASSGSRIQDEEWVIPRSMQLPTFTGTLTLHSDITDVLRILSSKFPECFRFRKIVQRCGHRDRLNTINAMVEKCSSTLEWIDIYHPSPIDLSKATKLKGAVFRIGRCGHAQKITKILDTITPCNEKFEQILIHLPTPVIIYPSSFAVDAELRLLNDALIRLWKLRGWRPIRLELMCYKGWGGKEATHEQVERCLERWFPGVMEGVRSGAWVPPFRQPEGSHVVRYTVESCRAFGLFPNGR